MKSLSRSSEIECQCPHCDQVYDVDPDMIGDQVDCDTCGGQFEVEKIGRIAGVPVSSPNLKRRPDWLIPIGVTAALMVLAVVILVAVNIDEITDGTSGAPEIEDSSSTPKETREYDPARSKRLRCEVKIEGWLSAMKDGEDTTEYWEYPALEQRLYSVKNWEILSINIAGEMAFATIQVESSTKGGFPIRKNWKLHLKDDIGWKLTLMTEE